MLDITNIWTTVTGVFCEKNSFRLWIFYNNTKMTCFQVSLFQRKWFVGELITWLWIATTDQNQAVIPLKNAMWSYIRIYMFFIKTLALCQSQVVNLKEAAVFSSKHRSRATLLHIHYEHKKIDLEQVVNMFASLHPRKRELQNLIFQ